MNDPKNIVGFIVCVALMIGGMVLQTREAGPYQAWTAKKQAHDAWTRRQLDRLKKGAPAPVPSAAVTGLPEKPTPAVPERRAAFLAKLEQQARDLAVPFTTAKHSARLSTTGGTLTSLTFPDVKEPSFRPVLPSGESDVPMAKLGSFEPLRLYDPKARSFALTTTHEPGIEQAEWLHVPVGEKGHRFERLLPDGDLLVAKEFLPLEKPGENDWHFTLRVSVTNQGTADRRFGYELLGPAGLVEPTSATPAPIAEAVLGFRDAAGGFEHHHRANATIVDDLKSKKPTLTVQTTRERRDRITYFGLGVKSFAAVVLPLGLDAPDGKETQLPVESASATTLLSLAGRAPTVDEQARAAKHEDSIAGQVAVSGRLSEFNVPAGQTVTQDYAVFVGPRWSSLLDNHPLYSGAGLGSGSGRLVDYSSWFPGVGVIANLLTKLLLGFHAVTTSWGVSIVLLTVLVRCGLHPLMVKQVKSAERMKSVQPQIAKIKAKYEDEKGELSPENQKRYQAEQMEFMKANGLINPLGCLGPIVCQLPIFIGLWSALSYAFELRGQSFLWIRDLSEPDVVGRLPFNLPMHGTNALCILPILMFGVYILQMRNMPKPADPQAAEQQKMMQWMMPVFGYMFYKMPAGLLLYYITSALLGMAEQKYIKRKLGIVDPQGAGLPPGSAPVRV